MSHIVCISASQVPSSTANSMQTMKACHALAKLGHQITLLLPGDKLTGWEELCTHYGLSDQFEIRWLPAAPRLRRYDFSWSAVSAANQQGADLVYVWPLQAALFAAYRHLPVILEIHGPPEGRLGPLLFRLLLRSSAKKRYLPITQALVTQLEHQFNFRFSPEELVVAPNGVDLEFYKILPTPSQARQGLGLPDKLTVGYTGHMYAGRGMGLLASLASRFPHIQFLWVGGRPEDLREWQHKLSTQGIENVTLTGFIENMRVPQYQAAADVLLMPYERFIAGSSGGNSADYCSPMKMFEYLACGRAIISSDLPVLLEVLNDSNAILCPPQDEDAWASALQELLDKPEKRNSLAQNALLTAVNHSWQSRAQKALRGFV
jgi:glycosyltransferase involved in cell wall biosynthesis